MRLVSIFICFFYYLSSFSQSIQLDSSKAVLSISGFLDVYHVYDFNSPQGTSRQPFLFNHNRHNEVNVNLGFIKLGVEHTKYRANLALQTGTYANDNYAAEPGLLKNIFEANVGLSLNKKNTLWLDAGVMPSHIGFESAISLDNMTLTRSLLAENSPYFLSGAKLTFTPNDTWEIAALIVNGWQRIQRLEGNSLPSLGTQINYKPTKNLTLNWSTFIGTDDLDTLRRMRYFNNFYSVLQTTKKINIIAGFDIGAQQQTINSDRYDIWYSPIIIAQFSINQTLKTAFRAEFYSDKTGIIIPVAQPQGLNTLGLSTNLDYSPAPNILCRVEGRWLKSHENIFENKGTMIDTNFIIASSIALRF